MGTIKAGDRVGPSELGIERGMFGRGGSGRHRTPQWRGVVVRLVHAKAGMCAMVLADGNKAPTLLALAFIEPYCGCGHPIRRHVTVMDHGDKPADYYCACPDCDVNCDSIPASMIQLTAHAPQEPT